MGSRLQEEIKQTKPFETLQQEVLLNLARTSAVLMHRLEREFRPFGVTFTQYNVLRIVQGAGSSGLSQFSVAERLVAQTPDVPRLLKRMESSGLIKRTEDRKDKRALNVCLTERGTDLLRQTEPFVRTINHTFFSNLTKAQLKTINSLLTAMRYHDLMI
jgi:DNA-binding MarR family transcriptional regulator